MSDLLKTNSTRYWNNYNLTQITHICYIYYFTYIGGFDVRKYPILILCFCIYLFPLKTYAKNSPTELYVKLIDELETTDDLSDWYEQYLDLIEENLDCYDPPESIKDYYSQSDIELLWRLVETEAGGTSFKSKVLIAEVVMNRMDSKEFPDDIYTVMTTKKQFSIKKKLNKVTDETKRACECAFQIPDLSQGALYFHSIKECENFFGKEFLFIDEDSGHKFYK